MKTNHKSNTTNIHSSLEGTFIDASKKWKLGEHLGSGACGSVYSLHRHASSTTSNTSNTSTTKNNTTHKDSFVIKIAPLPLITSSSSSTSKKRKKTAEEKNADVLFHEHILYLNVLNNLRGSMVPDIPLPGYSSSVPPSFGEFQVTLTVGTNNNNNNNNNSNNNMMKYRYLIMERMQDSFTSYLIPRILQNPILLSHVFVRLIQLMKSIHDLNYVFIDVKPENFMIAKQRKNHTNTRTTNTTVSTMENHHPNSNSNNNNNNRHSTMVAQQIRMIDVALMESTKDIMRNGKHRVDTYPDGQMVGTPIYASRHVMKGHTPSRRDDLEAIGYVVLELMMQVGTMASTSMSTTTTTSTSTTTTTASSEKDTIMVLPWSQGTSDEDVLQRKINAVEEKDHGVFWNTVEELVGTNAKHCMKEYLNMVSNLEFKEKPDYEALIKLVSGIQLQLSSNSGTTSSTRSSKRKTTRGGTMEETKTTSRKKKSTNKTTTSTPRKLEEKSPSIDSVHSPRAVRAATRNSRKVKNQVIVLNDDDNDDESPTMNSSHDVDMKPPPSVGDEQNEEESVEAMDWERTTTTTATTTAKPKPFLTIKCTSGPHKGESCILESSMVLGSHPKNQKVSSSSDSTIFSLSKDSHASSNHTKLILSCSGGTKKGVLMVKVTDLKSSSGTFLNGKALPKGGSRQAFVNDCIKVGTSEFRIKKS